MNEMTSSLSIDPMVRAPESSSRVLARIGQIAADAADEATLESARHILIDSLACAAGAADTTLGVQLLRDCAAEYPGGSSASTLANLIHLEEFDCLHDASATAPGILASAAVDVGLRLGSSMEEVLRAVVSGVEVAVQLGTALDAPGMYAGGYWPSSLSVKVGAAAAVARLLDLDEAGTTRAIAIAAITGAAACPRMICEAHYLSSGVAVDLGIRSAYWARSGIRAYESIFDDGPFPVAPSKLEASGSRTPRITEVAFKRYPCARPLHAVIEAVRHLVDGAHIDARDVTAVTVALPSGLLPFVNREIDPSVDALRRTSLDYVVGLALVDRAGDVEAYRGLLVDQQRIPVDLELGDSEVEALYPMQWSARVTIRVGDDVHTVLRGSAADAHTAGRPLTWLTDKWRDLGQDAGWLERLLRAPMSAPIASAHPLEVVQI